MASKLQTQFRIWLRGETVCSFKENARPDWLITGVGERCELDFYVEDLRLAVEIQGKQHYQFTPHFHASYEVFLAQKRRDEFKRIVCDAEGVKLLLIHNEGEFSLVKDYISRFQDALRPQPQLDDQVFARLKKTDKRFTARWKRNTRRLDRYKRRLMVCEDDKEKQQLEKAIRSYEQSLRQLLEMHKPAILAAL